MATTVPDNLSREQYVYLAKLAEQAERYEEMVQFMQKLFMTWLINIQRLLGRLLGVLKCDIDFRDPNCFS